MQYLKRITIWFLAAFALAGARAHCDLVLDWNAVLLDAVKEDLPSGQPTFGSRAMAITHLALAEGYNAVEKRWTPWLANPPRAPHRANSSAAAAEAAWYVMRMMYPVQAARFDAQLSATLQQLPNTKAVRDGRAVGLAVGQAIWKMRKADGSSGAVTYVPTGKPGHWEPTYPNFNPPTGQWWGNVKPFVMQSGHQFRVIPPPTLNSDEYTSSFLQMYSVGALKSKTRTPEQELIGHFWAYDRLGMCPPERLLNQMLHTIAAQQKNSLEQNMRLFALVNVAFADGGIACWESKYYYDTWRPITAIRKADMGHNPKTPADPKWEPLGAPGDGVFQNFTPSFPSYPSGHAVFGAVMFQIVARFYGTDHIACNLTSDETPGVVRSYPNLWKAAEECALSRIYIGVHSNYDVTQGLTQGRQLGNYVYGHLLLPKRSAASSS